MLGFPIGFPFGSSCCLQPAHSVFEEAHRPFYRAPILGLSRVFLLRCGAAHPAVPLVHRPGDFFSCLSPLDPQSSVSGAHAARVTEPPLEGAVIDCLYGPWARSGMPGREV